MKQSYSEDIGNRVVKGVLEGLSLDAAAYLAGVPLSTVLSWIRQGETIKSDAPVGAFARAVHAADGESVRSAIRAIVEAGKRDWKAAAWILNGRAPDTTRRAPRKRQRSAPLSILCSVLERHLAKGKAGS